MHFNCYIKLEEVKDYELNSSKQKYKNRNSNYEN
jgi:hypothetical protein